MLEKRRTQYDTLEAVPFGGALGAEIKGVDLSKPMKKEVFADVHQAWLDHQVITFRDQDLTPEQQIRFARKWGAIHRHPFMPTMEGWKWSTYWARASVVSRAGSTETKTGVTALALASLVSARMARPWVMGERLVGQISGQ